MPTDKSVTTKVPKLRTYYDKAATLEWIERLIEIGKPVKIPTSDLKAIRSAILSSET